jgi:hypothetical protein
VPELSGRELLSEWRALMDSVLGSAASAAERSGFPRDVVGTMQRQLELVADVVERERSLQRQFAGFLVAPIDAVFDLLEETGGTLRRQAEALQAAGRALEETAALMARQAELFERTVGALRQPTEIAKAATGLDQKTREAEAPAKGETRAAKQARKPRATRPRGGTGTEADIRAQGDASPSSDARSQRRASPRSTPRVRRETRAPRRKPKATGA